MKALHDIPSRPPVQIGYRALDYAVTGTAGTFQWGPQPWQRQRYYINGNFEGDEAREILAQLAHEAGTLRYARPGRRAALTVSPREYRLLLHSMEFNHMIGGQPRHRPMVFGFPLVVVDD